MRDLRVRRAGVCRRSRPPRRAGGTDRVGSACPERHPPALPSRRPRVVRPTSNGTGRSIPTVVHGTAIAIVSYTRAALRSQRESSVLLGDLALQTVGVAGASRRGRSPETDFLPRHAVSADARRPIRGALPCHVPKRARRCREIDDAWLSLISRGRPSYRSRRVRRLLAQCGASRAGHSSAATPLATPPSSPAVTVAGCGIPPRTFRFRRRVSRSRRDQNDRATVAAVEAVEARVALLNIRPSHDSGYGTHARTSSAPSRRSPPFRPGAGELAIVPIPRKDRRDAAVHARTVEPPGRRCADGAADKSASDR